MESKGHVILPESFMAQRTGNGKLNMATVTFAETALWLGVMAPSSLRPSRAPNGEIRTSRIRSADCPSCYLPSPPNFMWILRDIAFKISEYSSQASSLKPLHGFSMTCIPRMVYLL
jgi:hypothetical protein